MIVECGPVDNRLTTEIKVPTGKKVAVLLSSGADTAILLYLICLSLIEEGRDPNEEIHYIFTIPKADGAALHSPAIVEWINNKLNLSLPPPIVEGPENLEEIHHGEQVMESAAHLFNKYQFTYLFGGDQKAVPEPYKMPGVYPVRPIGPEHNPWPDFLSLPFNHMDKSHTIDLHFIFGTQRLLEISHSCTQQPSGRCGECYHCNERAWAFERLGKTDPGNN